MTETSFESGRITAYNFEPGLVLARKYEIVSQIETGIEGELYMLNERATGIERTAKFFFPHRNPQNRVANFYAKKLHKLRHCKILMQYRTQETISYEGTPVTFLVSDFIEGDFLPDFLETLPGKRFSLFEGLHFLHALARGLEQVHMALECHGHVTKENIMVTRHGLGFQVKLVDLVQASTQTKPETIREDVYNILKVFYESIGGARVYAKLPEEIKEIFCGLRRSLVAKKFRNAGALRRHLETMRWY